MRFVSRIMICFAILSPPLTSCSSVEPMSTGAKSLREISGDSGACTLIAAEKVNNHSLGQHPGVCKERAIAAMKERIAQLGANAYRYEVTSYNACLLGGTTVAFEAFRCP